MRDQLKQVLADAVAHSDSREERVRFLKEQLGVDDELLEEALSLIRYASKRWSAPGLSKAVPLDKRTTVGEPLTEGARISDYRLISQIGRGASGTVWLAIQEVFDREVALKVLVRGVGESVFTERFLFEQMVLASMSHSNIAQVYDAGTAPGGSPYYVMELVSGLALDEHCDKYSLSLRDRLALVVRVCRAVHHAHQRTVIHRDLKPSNILCTLDDEGVNQPKVIDFGIAQAEGPQTPVDSTGVVVGTLHYMSPEQSQSSSDLTVATDVYSLGVITYELLSGVRPLEGVLDPERGLQDNLKAIQVSPVPSMRAALDQADATRDEIVARRRTVLKVLRRRLTDELEWIVKRAMAKDSAQRYDSAESLARDIERYLQGDVVQVAPPSARYRFRKFVSRYRAPLSALAALVAILVAGAVTSTTLYVQAEQARASVAKQLRTSRLLSVELSLQAGDVSGARAALQSLKPEERGWLWHLLAKRADSSRQQHDWRQLPVATRVDVDGHVEVLLHDGAVHVWEADGSSVRQDRAHIPGNPKLVALAPGGGRIAYSNDEDDIFVVERTGLEAIKVASLEQQSSTLTFHPRGTSLLVSELGGRLIKIDLESVGMKVLFEPRALSAGSGGGEFLYHDVVISLDGGKVAVTTNTNVVRILDVWNGQLLDEIVVDASPSCLAFDSAGEWLAIGGRDGVIRVRSLTTERIDSFIAHPAAVLAMTFADIDSRPTLFSADEDGRIHAFDQRSWDRVGEAFGHDAPVTQLTADTSRHRLVSASTDGTTRIWPLDLRTSRTIPLDQFGDHKLLASSAHSAVLAVGSEIKVARSPWQSPPTVIDSDGQSVLQALLVHQGDWVLMAREGGTVEALPTREGPSRRTLATDFEFVWTLADGGPWVAAGNDLGEVRWWNLGGRGEGRIDSIGTSVDALAFDRHAEHLAVGTADGRIIIVKTQNGTQIRSIQAHPHRAVSALCFSLSGPEVLYSAARRSEGKVDPIRSWSLPQGLPESDVGHSETTVEVLACHPVEGWILAAERNAWVRVFDPESLGLITVVRPAGGLLKHATVDPVDGTLCTITQGGIVEVW